jgi:hypothetical protein
MFDSYLQSVKELIAQHKLNDALLSLQIFVERIMMEPHCTGKFFGSPELDHLCQEIGAVSLKQIKAEQSGEADNWQDTFVIIATHVARYGGHTRVIEDLLKFAPHKKKILYLTNLMGKSDLDFIVPRLQGRGVEIVILNKGDRVQRLRDLQQHLIREKPDSLWLFNHHQDAIAVAAVQPGMARQNYYYHHADHHLALGVYMAGWDHVDLSPFTYHVCQANGVYNQRYLPLYVDDPLQKKGSFKTGASMLTATVSNNNKIELPYTLYYSQVIVDVMKAVGHRHLHIGQLSKLTLRRIKKNMAAAGVPADRFINIQWSDCISRTFQDYDVDFYIASFPNGGAKTQVEVMGAGLPVAVHYNPAMRLLGGIDMASDATFIWSRPEELIAYLQRVTPDDLAIAGGQERLFYEAHHGEKITRQALAEGVFPACPPLKPLSIPTQSIQQALDICQSTTLRPLVRMLFWRTLRFLRSFCARWKRRIG